MRILAIGCLHGVVPRGLKNICRKEKPDAILSVGDFSFDLELRNLFFRYSYRSGIPLEEVIGEKKYRRLEKRNDKAGERVIKYLDSIGLPVITITGNWDSAGWMDISESKKAWDHIDEEDTFTPMIKKYKNFKVIDFKSVKFKGFRIIGYPRTTWTGKRVRGRNPPALLKNYKRHYNKLAKMFKKGKKEKVIFLCHNPPYGKVDMISKKAVKAVRGKHGGSLVSKELIQKYKPLLCICGHIHEARGKDKIGKTLVVNSGGFGKYAIIDIADKTGNVKIILR